MSWHKKTINSEKTKNCIQTHPTPKNTTPMTCASKVKVDDALHLAQDINIPYIISSMHAAVSVLSFMEEASF